MLIDSAFYFILYSIKNNLGLANYCQTDFYNFQLKSIFVFAFNLKCVQVVYYKSILVELVLDFFLF